MTKAIHQPTRVAILTGQLGKGGAERQLYLFLKYADRQRFDYRVFVLNPEGWWQQQIADLNIDITCLPAETRARALRLGKIYKWLSRFRPHILHSWNLYPTPYVILAGWLARTPIKMAFLQGQLDYHIGSIGSLGRLSVKYLDTLIANSETERVKLERMLPSRPSTYLLRNAVKIPGNAHGSKIVHTARSTFTLGTIGRLDENKNHNMFLKVVKCLTEAGYNARGVIAVDGPLRSTLGNRIEEMGLVGMVELVGQVDDIGGLLEDTDVFCFTSRSEGLSNAIMEAMAAGVPVVATDVGGIRELIDDGESGFIVPSEDIDAMVDKVQLLLSSRELRGKIGTAGREKMKCEFTVERMVETLQSVYLQLLKEKCDRHRQL